jgi:hypothetical protein
LPAGDCRELAGGFDRYRASGPVLVLVGEADFTSITRLDEALTAQIFGQAA